MLSLVIAGNRRVAYQDDEILEAMAQARLVGEDGTPCVLYHLTDGQQTTRGDVESRSVVEWRKMPAGYCRPVV